MTADHFHLAWFLGGGFGVGNWNGPFGGGRSVRWNRPDSFIDFARSLERACFDYLIIEDSSFVCDAYGGSAQIYLENAMTVPKQDPAVLATILTQFTTRLGIVPTLTVTEYPPFLLARLVSTLDHVSAGRAGWNIVTGSSDRAAQNYGKPEQPPHDIRYDMADEFTEIVCRLWESWEADAVVADVDTGVYVDHTKVHTIDFQGKYFSCRGPLNTARPPQGRPVLVQAGGSPRGREFAAKNADTIIASATNIDEMKEYRDDVRSRMERMGRKPDDCKVLFLVSPTVGETIVEAQEKRLRHDVRAVEHPELALASIGFITDIDFSVYDVDAPLGELTTTLETNGHQSSLAHMLKVGPEKTLRDVATVSHGFEPVGTPDSIAATMQYVMEEVGGDGFLFYLPDMDARAVREITEGIVPQLQRRGLVRTEYTFEHFRDNLLEF
jgi:FMN-dependent oxidoreductase (nitrilotriacetate monooxygenase family)